MSFLIRIALTLLISLSATAKTIESPLLWKADKEGKVAYIFGTFHLGTGLSDLPKDFKKYIDDSTNIIMETDLESVDQNDLISRAMYPAGRSLDQFLSEGSWESLAEQLSDIAPKKLLKKFKPWYINNFLILGASLKQLNLTGSLDLDLKNYAKSKNKNLLYLESAGTQFSVIEAITPIHIFDEMIRENENLIEYNKKEMINLYNCYQASDLECIAKSLKGKDSDGPLETMQIDLLLKQRNRTWIPVIEEFLEKGPSFIAVGTGHLVNEDNVLSLLKEKGYKVERVSN